MMAEKMVSQMVGTWVAWRDDWKVVEWVESWVNWTAEMMVELMAALKGASRVVW
jgi:hypothetical protein